MHAKPHAFALPGARKRSTVNGCPWQVCTHCGLVLLKNQATAQAAKKPCEGREDPPDPVRR